jgi:para-nitrobenzyl esterase
MSARPKNAPIETKARMDSYFKRVIPIASLALASAFSTNASAQPSSHRLDGTAWQLVQIKSMDDSVVTPDERSKYTIAFGADGRLSIRVDCNRGNGTWKSAEASQLVLELSALTRAMCPPGSLHDRIVKDMPYVRSYLIGREHLYLSLVADGGIYEFERMPTGGPGSTGVRPK